MPSALQMQTVSLCIKSIILSQDGGKNLCLSECRILSYLDLSSSFPDGASGKEPSYHCRRCKRHVFDPWVRKIPWKRAWQPTPVFFPGESHGQRSLTGYNPWGCKESDRTEAIQQCTQTDLGSCPCLILTSYVMLVKFLNLSEPWVSSALFFVLPIK